MGSLSYMIVCCITAVVNVVENYIFIPLWGAKAAAGTTALCGLTILILLLFKVDKHVKVEKVGRLILAPVIGCAGIITVCLMCRYIENLWIRMIVSVTCSIGIYGLVQGLLKNELVSELLVAMKRRMKKV